ncbi:unnamed protein product [Moneuplotes crassus]|uniref:PIPK domain-containing protein n=2 Tax=Euplotes crassus TaxID=5936 RepID=A0AAD1Y824_EUPCR|nr:unnamed protein product [Moneuplotes crassus]
MEQEFSDLTLNNTASCFKPDSIRYNIPPELKTPYVIVGSLSIIAATFLFVTIFTVKKLKAHPSIMIGYISLFEAISAFHSILWAVSTLEYVEYFGLGHLFTWTITFDQSSTYHSCFTLCILNQLLGFSLFSVLSLGMNMCLCIDLVLTLRAPFYPAKRRFKFYLMFSFLLSIIMMIVSIPKVKDTCPSATEANASQRQNSAMAVILTLYILVSLFSIVYAARMLSRPGISSEIRDIFMKKHVLYSLSFIIIWTLNLLNTYHALYRDIGKKSLEAEGLKAEGYSLQYIRLPSGLEVQVRVNEDTNEAHFTVFQIISVFASLSTGLVMGIIRCFEPYFAFLMVRTFKSFYGVTVSEEEINERNNKLTDTISAFLNSSLNIELVHIILKAITQECTKFELEEGAWANQPISDTNFSEKKKCKIHEIEIKDPAKWGLFDEPVKALSNVKFNILKREDGMSDDKDILTINEDIAIEELAPTIFATIRNQEGITKEHIIESLSPEFNRDMVFKAGEGQGKSGSFFFFSHDRRFIIKTMNDEEYQTFKRIFRKYTRHLLKHQDSLLARIFGIFTVKREKLTPVHLILMGNTCTLQGKKLKYMFDLKGSFVNRETKVGKVHKPSQTLKDINLLNLKMQENFLKFTKVDADKIMERMKKDVPILKRGNIMDYSLLLAIEENPNYGRQAASSLKKLSSDLEEVPLTQKFSIQNQEEESKNIDEEDKTPDEDTEPSHATDFQESRHMFMSSNMQYIYHISIIDYLQDYNFDKKLENFAKTIMRGTKAEISAVNPKRYRKRFIDFMESEVIVVGKKSNSFKIERLESK